MRAAGRGGRGNKTSRKPNEDPLARALGAPGGKKKNQNPGGGGAFASRFASRFVSARLPHLGQPLEVLVLLPVELELPLQPLRAVVKVRAPRRAPPVILRRARNAPVPQRRVPDDVRLHRVPHRAPHRLLRALAHGLRPALVVDEAREPPLAALRVLHDEEEELVELPRACSDVAADVRRGRPRRRDELGLVPGGLRILRRVELALRVHERLGQALAEALGALARPREVLLLPRLEGGHHDREALEDHVRDERARRGGRARVGARGLRVALPARAGGGGAGGGEREARRGRGGGVRGRERDRRAPTPLRRGGRGAARDRSRGGDAERAIAQSAEHRGDAATREGLEARASAGGGVCEATAKARATEGFVRARRGAEVLQLPEPRDEPRGDRQRRAARAGSVLRFLAWSRLFWSISIFFTE